MKVKCPNCKKEVIWSKEAEFRPFCSERCRLIDLGAWADESYTVPAESPPDDEDFDDNLDESQDVTDDDA